MIEETTNEESIFDGLDRTCFDLSFKSESIFSTICEKVFYRLWAPLDPNKFDNSTSKIKELAIRTFIVIGLVATVVLTGLYSAVALAALAVSSKVFRAIGFYLQKDGSTHVRGKAMEKAITNGEASVMTWNICGFGGGLHYDKGGVIHWRSRIDRIVENIKKENPDILVLEEVYDGGLVEAIIEKLENDYAHFYTYLGKNTFGNESGLMVITKCPVHSFSHTDFYGNDDSDTRGFSTLEVKASKNDFAPILRIIGADTRRLEDFSQIVDKVSRFKTSIATLLVGSSHVDRDDPEEGKYLEGFLFHSHLSDEKTKTDELRSQWVGIKGKMETFSDFISLFKRKIADGRTLSVVEKGIRLKDSHIIKGFDQNYQTNSAVSSHHGIISTISGLKRQVG